MGNPLFDLYVEAGNPLSEIDVDIVNQWAVDRINELEEKISKQRRDEFICQRCGLRKEADDVIIDF